MTPVATGFDSHTHRALEGTCVVLAIFVHAALIGGMPTPPDRSAVVALGDAVDMSFVEEEAEPEEVVEPEPVKPPPRRRRVRTAKKPAPPTEAPPVPQETPAPFDNVVLTEEGSNDSSWSTEEGSGKSVEGPIGSPNAAVTGESKMGAGGGMGVVIYTGDLSREILPPPLNQMVKGPALKRAGAASVEGEAFVRLQIGADGVPSHWQVILEDPTGYQLGKACIKTLKREAWQAPLGEDGRPITTRIIYRCGYEIRY